MLQEFISYSPEETEALGATLARKAAARPQALFALYGDLGAGKTALVRGAARALGDEGAASPTFAILHEYDTTPPLYHFDLYRLRGGEDLEAVGFFDVLSRQGLVFVEWPERGEGCLPEERIDVRIQRLDERTRKISVEGLD